MRIDRVLCCAFAIMIGAAGFARADQAMCLDTEAAARRAAGMLENGAQMREYCAPCSDAGWKATTINSVEVYDRGPECGWAVKVNGADIDLAYVYVLDGKKGKKGKKGKDGRDGKKGAWTNLAKLAKVEVHSVPDTLPEDLPELTGETAP